MPGYTMYSSHLLRNGLILNIDISVKLNVRENKHFVCLLK